ncbi:MAG: alpha/beta hydrolase [Saprospiraceae bacterium]|nr:alpha/beta hydrolase [Saprospiraceae bacterium]
MKIQMARHYSIYATKAKEERLFGRLDMVKEKLKTTIQFDTLDAMMLQILNEHSHCRGVLFYIHGFMADYSSFEENTGQILHQYVFNPLFEHYDLIISLKWNATLDYRKCIDYAYEKGKYFGIDVLQIVSELKSKNPSLKVSFINHSMGNWVFCGLMRQISLAGDKAMNLDDILLFAADIPSDVFENTLSMLPGMSKRIFIFYNHEDRTLKGANLIVPFKRLGIYGPEQTDLKFYLLNCTEIKDNEGISPNLFLHRYYYSSPSVRAGILAILSGQKQIKLGLSTYLLE